MGRWDHCCRNCFPPTSSYTGSAVVYNLAGDLGASPAPIIAVALWRPDGNIAEVGLYLSAAGLLSLIALLGVRETRDIDYTAQTPPSEPPARPETPTHPAAPMSPEVAVPPGP